jgi:hypothetical protein
MDPLVSARGPLPNARIVPNDINIGKMGDFFHMTTLPTLEMHCGVQVMVLLRKKVKELCSLTGSRISLRSET